MLARDCKPLVPIRPRAIPKPTFWNSLMEHLQPAAEIAYLAHRQLSANRNARSVELQMTRLVWTDRAKIIRGHQMHHVASSGVREAKQRGWDSLRAIPMVSSRGGARTSQRGSRSCSRMHLTSDERMTTVITNSLHSPRRPQARSETVPLSAPSRQIKGRKGRYSIVKVLLDLKLCGNLEISRDDMRHLSRRRHTVRHCCGWGKWRW